MLVTRVENHIILEQYIKLICRPEENQALTKREVVETMQDRLMASNYAISGDL